MVSNDDSLVSDVQNIDTINLDDYYIGCDSRISLSTTITKDMIKYWINAQNDLVVQRYLSLTGSAALGDVLIEFSLIDALKYSVALNGALDSYKSILKTISNSQFDYIENNATIIGWISDIKKALDISDSYTLTDDPGNGINAYDDVMSTVTDTNSTASTIFETFLEVSFTPVYITNAHMRIAHTGTTTAHTSTIRMMGYDELSSSWVAISDEFPRTSDKNFGYVNSHKNGYSYQLSKVAIQQKSNSGSYAVEGKVYDITIF